jgi:hypothetical protein
MKASTPIDRTPKRHTVTKMRSCLGIANPVSQSRMAGDLLPE